MTFRLPLDPTAARVRRSFPHAFTALAFAVAASALACSEDPARVVNGDGYLRVAADAPDADSCISSTASGTLQIRSLDGRSSVRVAASELSAERGAERTLPAGIYAVSWLPTPSRDDVLWRLREPQVLTVSAGRVTEVHVVREPPACDMLARSP